MPGLDGTGPQGEGPMTGGGRGFCNPAGAANRPRYGWGYGYGRGWGFRRGFGPRYGLGFGYGRGFGWGGAYAPAYGPPHPMDPAQEARMLKSEADSMRSALDEINRRIEELERQSQK